MKYLLSTGCSINKVPKVRHCNNQYTNKDTFLLTSIDQVYVQNVLRHGPFYTKVHLYDIFHLKTLIEPLQYHSSNLKNGKSGILWQIMIS